MKNLWLVMQREYLSRIQKPSFIWATVLTPLAFALFVVIIGLIYSYVDDDQTKVAVIDEAGILDNLIENDEKLTFQFTKEKLVDLKENFAENDWGGILVLPPMQDIKEEKYTALFYTQGHLGLELSKTLEKRIADRIRDFKSKEMNYDKDRLTMLKTRVVVDPEPVDANAKDRSTIAALVAAGIGGVLGFVMYSTVFAYGMMIMRSVSEEKHNRIVEVLISSVKPIELMMGKIVGVGAVGLTQIAIWSVLMPLVAFILSAVFALNIEDTTAGLNMENIPAESAEILDAIPQIIIEIKSQNWLIMAPVFAFYFLGGYFLYSSMFAAVGSVVGDDTGEGESLSFPITLPIIISLFIMFFVVIKAPDSDLSVWASIIPFSSPIVMPACMTFNPPIWQVVLSISLLFLTCILFAWLSARIYRAGILLYGKKFNFAEIVKLLNYKN